MKTKNYISFMDELEDVNSTNFKYLLNSIEYNVSKIAKIEKQLETNKKKIEEISIEYLGLKEKKKEEDIMNLQEKLKETSTPPIDEEFKIPVKEYNEIEKKIVGKLFKILALKCHPDKTTDPYKNKIFVYANETKDDIDCIKLLYLFSKIDKIDITFEKDETEYIESKIFEMETRQISLKDTIAYKWDTLTPEQKNSYFILLKKYT